MNLYEKRERRAYITAIKIVVMEMVKVVSLFTLTFAAIIMLMIVVQVCISLLVGRW